MSYLLSPDTETFSTPPTTPGAVRDSHIMPSLSRRNSRPSTLHIDRTSKAWNPDVELDEPSPEISKNHVENLVAPNLHDPSTTPKSSAAALSPNLESLKQLARQEMPMNSPCFVHSHLDKGASLTDWLRNKHEAFVGVPTPVVPVNGVRNTSDMPPPTSTTVESSEGEDDDYGGSLTKQLAATAVGVRELSKQLGRARVRSNMQNILIITKARDNRLIKLTRELALYLMLKPRHGQDRGLVVYVDNQLRHSRRFDADGIERDHPELFVPFPRRRTSSSSSLASMSTSSSKEEFQLKDEGQLRYWTSDMCINSPHLFDFVVTLGGDGTVLFTSWLFQRIVPPVLPFALGSLGFLTNFDFADNQAVMDSAIDSGIRVNLRMRFTCTVYRAVTVEAGKGRKAVKNRETGEIMMKNVEKGGWEALEGGWSGAYQTPEESKSTKDKEIMCFTTRPVETFEILNDLVVDRGPSPYVSLLELFGDEHHMTTVQADGLTVSTPTGSTAYSLSAGGSLVHPEIPAILITPICPHTLSFRPMLLPDSMELRICVPFNSRSTAWASFDGRGRVELKQGDHIKVTASKYPFPTVCADKQSTDWFHAISRTLKWNERERQKSFVVVEEGPASSKPKRRSRRTSSDLKVDVTAPEPVEETLEDEEEDEVSDEPEEEEEFDIADSSPEATAALKASKEAAIQERHHRDKGRDTLSAASTSLVNGRGKRHASKSRSRSRSSGLRSGVVTPGRFAGPQPHPPAVNPRHVGFTHEVNDFDEQRGSRDDIYSSRAALSSAKSRIPKDRDLDLENVKTPTASVGPAKTRAHHRAGSAEQNGGHRAFAVWGQDESDSNASDSDA